MADKKKKKRSRKKDQKQKLILIGIGVVIMLVLLFFAVFQVRYVIVSGNTKYTDEEIEAMVVDDMVTGNTILCSLFRQHVDLSDIPFMDSADIEYLSYNSITIDVVEKKPVGYMYVQNNLVYFDKDGVVIELIPYEGGDAEGAEGADTGLVAEGMDQGMQPEELQPENTEEQAQEPAEPISGEAVQTARVSVSEFQPSLENVPLVTGIYVSEAIENQKLEVTDANIFRTMLALIRMIEKYNISPESVEISQQGELILHYFKSVRVNLGKDEELEEKMTKLAAIHPELEGLSGVLHMENYSEESRSFVFDKD